MKLEKLFKTTHIRNLIHPSGLQVIREKGVVEIKGITDDSRKVRSGYIFVAIKGLENDGHDFIMKAVTSGASVIIYSDESKISDVRRKTVFVRAINTRKILGLLWASWYDFPSDRLKIIGVTGTDGKTTTSNLIYHILKTSHQKVGLVSTINARIGEREIDTGFHVTSPQPELLQKILREMADEGIKYVVLEVTSHGLDQERTSGVDFYGATITNVTHEHLDYHKTPDAYLKTKGKLFKNVKFSVLNKDDISFKYLSALAEGKIISYGTKKSADLEADQIELVGKGSRFFLVRRGDTAGEKGEATKERTEVNLKLPGFYNVSNALAAAAVCFELGLNVEQIKKGLEEFSHLEGRFDEVDLGQPFRVIVDFAHTPNALEQALKITSKLKVTPESGRLENGYDSKLILVFGCAGERDQKKRPMMGEVAGRLADLTVLTAEDPRRENVNSIIDQIAHGCREGGAAELERSKNSAVRNKPGRRFFIRIPDRRKAIEFAIKSTGPNDIILITGKGHEKSMCFGGVECPWNDKDVTLDLLKAHLSRETDKKAR